MQAIILTIASLIASLVIGLTGLVSSPVAHYEHPIKKDHQVSLVPSCESVYPEEVSPETWVMLQTQGWMLDGKSLSPSVCSDK